MPTLFDQWNQMSPPQQQQYMAQVLGLGQRQGQPPMANNPAQGTSGTSGTLGGNALSPTPNQQLDPVTQGMLANYQMMQPIIQGQGLYGTLAPQGQQATSPYPMAGGYSGWGGTG